MSWNSINRRQFLQAAAGAAVGLQTSIMFATNQSQGVAIIIDPKDMITSSIPVKWAISELEQALAGHGVPVGVYHNTEEAPAAYRRIVILSTTFYKETMWEYKAAEIQVQDFPETLALLQQKEELLAGGNDSRGLMYAILELADRVRNASDPLAALAITKSINEHPANVVRSITRLFTSEIEDKPWYNDREMWPAYFSMLASNRFNRFNLALGIGYDFLTNVTDGYFLFAYPFLLSVPGYNVRVPQLPDTERDSNLEMLRFISEQAVNHGIDFQLGIWMHGYEWTRSPNANYTIEGLTNEIQGPYCRDALKTLLQAVPKISGITFRIHGESGVAEGNYDFWKTVFDGVAKCGRKVEIDMHAKGMSQGMIDVALGTGQPVKVSPKYWAEHLGMPYHQADIREQERPRSNSEGRGLMALSSGSRSFLRYGYGDLLQENRKWGVLHRIWPGTQRLLIWGDPLTAAAYSRAFSFCGSDGVEIMEPLSFKGRRGSGIAGGRCAYADKSLNPRWDWQKYEYSYRLWGRLLYNPQADPDVWKRAMHKEFGTAGEDLGTALSLSSRILPTVTTAHSPSAGNNTYWPEVYLNHSLIDPSRSGPYSDSPSPRVFGTVSPLDPQLFYRIIDFAEDLLKNERSGKYTPIEVAQWIEDYSAGAIAFLQSGDTKATEKNKSEYRRLTIDISTAAALGRFFGAKFRAGVLYHIFDKTGDRAALEQALKMYRNARDTWAAIAKQTEGVYMTDITVGETRVLRGNWSERLADIDTDINEIAAKLDSAKPAQKDGPIARAIAEVVGKPQNRMANGKHIPPEKFQPGKSLILEFSAEKDYTSAKLYYRHVNHAERWQSEPMKAENRLWNSEIPAEYTQSLYAIQYYFELRQTPELAVLYPGLGEQKAGQPYFVVRRQQI
jgi:hypothetical protein